MIIALTGTPGTGKTTIATLLQQYITVIDFQKFAITHHCEVGYDSDKDSIIIDVDKVNIALQNHINSSKSVLIEGHLSHLLTAVEKIIILRCHPKTLLKRLNEKGWKQQKIKENLEAEMLDVILSESIEIHSEENISEIDTTNQSPNSIVTSIKSLINSHFKKDIATRPGSIDWSEYLIHINWMEELNGS